MSSFGRGREMPEEDDEINITAMIDVVLLLLIFFMITSSMETSTTLQIPPADNGKDVLVDQSVVVTIFKTTGDPEIYLSDGAKENGPSDLEGVKSHVREGVASGLRSVILKADRDLPSGFVEDVARAAADVDPELKFYVGVMDKP